MRTRTSASGCLAVVIVSCLMSAGAPVLAQHSGGHPGGGAPAGAGGPHQHLDTRFSHNQFYYDHGYAVHRPPPGGAELHGRDGGRYWFHGGNWYRWRGGAWVVGGPPIGMFVPALPLYYTTVWWNGVPYYYANDAYYMWVPEQQQYEVVAPPDGIEASGSTQPPVGNDLFVYPKNGQSSEQQSKDEFDCHRWAVDQTGFDPTKPQGGVPPEQGTDKRSDYLRAKTSCLEGRGYSVK